MTTFAVFGMTESHAYRLAKRTASPQWLEKEKRMETPSELEERINHHARSIMSGRRVSQVSQLFDAPQYCRDFIELAQRSGVNRSLQIKRREQVEVTKNGKVTRQTVWHSYISQGIAHVV